MAIIDFPILYVPDPTKGKPLFYGQIFVGNPDTDPEQPTNQKQLNIVQEDGTKVPVDQPFILSAGGVPVYNGSPVRLDVDGNYSIKILNRLGAQAYYIENIFEGEPVTEEELPQYVSAEFSTVNDMVNGSSINLGNVDWNDYTGRIASTGFNNSTSRKGGAYYTIKTIAQASSDGDIIDDIANHALSGGTHVAVIREENPSEWQLGLEVLDKTAPDEIYNLIVAGYLNFAPNNITTLEAAGAQWAAGNKFPIAGFGDSTNDGRVSTIDGVNEMTQYNSVLRLDGSGNVPDGISYDHDASEAPNCWISVLQRMARDFYGQTSLRFYNAGFRGKQVADGWATANVFNAVYGNSDYADAKMIAINFGINDSENWDSEELRERTYQYTKALIHDAYLRGVQPFLMTTNAFCGTSDAGSSYGENTETVQIIDAVKRDLAKEYGLELVDMSEFLYDFIYRNGEAYSSDYLIPDDIHGQDTVHMKQAEYFFYKHLSGGLVIDSEDKLIVDVIHPAARWPISMQWLATGTYSQGASVLRRSFRVTSDFIGIAMDDFKYYDLWVWCDRPKVACIYYGFPGETSDPSAAASNVSFPYLRVLSNQFSASNQEFDIYNDILPTMACGNLAAEFTENPQTQHYIGELRYGLNIIRVGFDSGAEADFNNWVTDNIRIGFFGFFDDTQFSVRAPYQNGVSENAINGVKPWRIAAEHIDYTSRDVGNAINEILPIESHKFNNLYSINKVGDYVEFQFKWDATQRFGYILSAIPDINLSQVGNFDFYKDEYFFATFSVFANTSAGLSTILTTDVANKTFAYSSAMPTVTLAQVAGKLVTFRLSLDSISQLTLYLYDDAGTLLSTHPLDANLSRALLSGKAGGTWHNYDDEPTGSMSLPYMKIRHGQ